MVSEEVVVEHIKRAEAAKSRRDQFTTHWDDLSRVMHPRRQGFSTTTVDGDMRTEDIYDGTPMQAARSLANTVGAMIRPEGQNLFIVKAESGRCLECIKLGI